jgi:hypothetical protein
MQTFTNKLDTVSEASRVYCMACGFLHQIRTNIRTKKSAPPKAPQLSFRQEVANGEPQ